MSEVGGDSCMYHINIVDPQTVPEDQNGMIAFEVVFALS